jgi:hypothetical protein
VQPDGLPETALAPDDLDLLRRDPTPSRAWDRSTFESRWLDPAERVPDHHVIIAAARARRSPRAVASRLVDLGFILAKRPARFPGTALTSDDLALVSRNLDGAAPWLTSDEPVPAGRVIAAAAEVRWSPRAVAARLTRLGFVLAVDPDSLSGTALTTEDHDLLRRDVVDGRLLSLAIREWPWLDPGTPVPCSYVIAAAVKLHRRPAAVADRLRELGFDVADLAPATATPGSSRDFS